MEFFLNLFFKEIASKELNSLQEQKNNIENEIRELEEKAVALQELYNEQEQLLSQIFGGKYVLTEKIWVVRKVEKGFFLLFVECMQKNISAIIFICTFINIRCLWLRRRKPLGEYFRSNRGNAK